jgi:tripartite-type tricarboxylate transporter receptor subunit TctC
MPQPVVDKIYRETAKALQLPDVRDCFGRAGAEPMTSTPAEFGAYVLSEFTKYGKLVRDNDIKAD